MKKDEISANSREQSCLQEKKKYSTRLQHPCLLQALTQMPDYLMPSAPVAKNLLNYGTTHA